MSSSAGSVTTPTTSSTNLPAYHKESSVRTPSISETSIHGQPTRPPGLLPLPGERLWKPHEDKYWASIREMWGSNVDLNEHDDIHETHQPTSTQGDHDAREHDSKDEMHDVDLCVTNGTVFRIVLPTQPQNTTPERDYNHIPAGGRNSSGRVTGAPRPSINHTPLNDAISLHLPLPTLHKPDSNTRNKGRRAFQGSALNVSVTTSTRTYSDFSTLNPPPYTPLPTGRERSFGRSGKFAAMGDDKKSKWPVAKWLFFLGFFLPLLWLFGSCLLLSGLRKMSADAQAEPEHAASKSDTHFYDTNTESLTQLIAQEVVWSKRCAWAFAVFASICFVVLGILKGLGM